MNAHCPRIEQLVANLDDSISKTDRRELENHMVQCRVCRTASAELFSIDRILTTTTRPAPSQVLLDRYHRNLAVRFGNHHHAVIRQNWLSRFRLHPSPVLVVQAGTFMMIGLTIGWFLFHQGWRTADVREAFYTPSIARQIDTYFHESKIWLLDMINLPQNGDLDLKDWTMTRDDAERVLRKTIAIRELTPIGQDPRLDGYLNGLEILLMELINGQTADRSEVVEQIKQTIVDFKLLLRAGLLQEDLRVSQQI